MTDNAIVHAYLLGLGRGGHTGGFYSNSIAKELRCGHREVLLELSKLIDNDLLFFRYEIRCSSVKCFKPVTILETGNYRNVMCNCQHCGNEFESDEDLVRKVFYFKS